MSQKMFSFVIFVLFLIAPFHVSAQKISKESLDNAVGNIESTYKAAQDLTASFAQKTYMAILNKNLANSGVLKWKKPGMFFIDYTGNQPKQYISNNKTMWIYIPGDSQVEVYKVSNKSISREALEFMRGFVDIRRNYKIVAWKKSGAKTEMSMVPIFQGAPYSKLDCVFGPNNLLERVTIHNTSGNTSEYLFSAVQINNGLSDKIFEFKNPGGVREVRVK